MFYDTTGRSAVWHRLARHRAEWMMALLESPSASGKDQTYLEQICHTAGVEPNRQRLEKALVLYAGRLSTDEWNNLQQKEEKSIIRLTQEVLRVCSFTVHSGSLNTDNRLSRVMKALKATDSDGFSLYEMWRKSTQGNESSIEKSIGSYLITLDDRGFNNLLGDIKKEDGDYIMSLFRHVCETIEKEKGRSR